MSACGVCGLDMETISPRDAVAALRSFPRRFGALVPTHGGDEGGVGGVGGEGGVGSEAIRAAVLSEAGAAAAEIAATAEALEHVLIEDNPVLPTSPPPGGGSPAAHAGVDGLERLEEVARALALRAEQTPGADWGRPATRGGTSVRAIDLLREAVHAGVHHLRSATETANRLSGTDA